MAKTNLKEYFPMIREREELLTEIEKTPKLAGMYHSWRPVIQKEFVDFCTGAKGVKILYDSFFKEVMNPEYDRGRLEDFLSTVLKKKLRIVRILPNDSTRIADETSLLITDIVVELEDGSLANVEIQKIGYAFPGERCACYGADMLLRQYKRVRAKRGNDFSYRDVKNVYLIVIYEKSTVEFKEFPDIYYHHSKQIFGSGLKMNLLQEFVMIPLDNFRNKMHNKAIETPLEAWLTFLGEDNPERIIELITAYPQFKGMYETLYRMCRDIERVMGMFFSEELRIMDQNTVKYMIEEQQKEIDTYKEEIAVYKNQLWQSNERITQLERELAGLKG